MDMPRDPSPKKIAAICRRIQAGWDARTEEFRRGRFPPAANVITDLDTAWTPPVIPLNSLDLLDGPDPTN